MSDKMKTRSGLLFLRLCPKKNCLRRRKNLLSSQRKEEIDRQEKGENRDAERLLIP
jgi:hypothetical protein